MNEWEKFNAALTDERVAHLAQALEQFFGPELLDKKQFVSSNELMARPGKEHCDPAFRARVLIGSAYDFLRWGN